METTYKDAYYFSHDAGARNDEKILNIRSKYDWEGYGWYFAICELFRESSDYTLSNNIALLKLCLNISKESFEAFLQECFDCKLFEFCGTDKTRFYSESFMRRMELINDKHRKAAESGRLGGLAKAKGFRRRHSDAKAKSKQGKEKEKKEKEKEITPPARKTGESEVLNFSFEDFWNLYDKKMVELACRHRWHKITDAEKQLIREHLPLYIEATPDKRFRKDPLHYLTEKGWLNEIIQPPGMTGAGFWPLPGSPPKI